MFIHRENALKAHQHISYCSILVTLKKKFRSWSLTTKQDRSWSLTTKHVLEIDYLIINDIFINTCNLTLSFDYQQCCIT